VVGEAVDDSEEDEVAEDDKNKDQTNARGC